MITLYKYLCESLVDDFDDLSKNADEGIKQKIKQFLEDNFKGASKCKISKNPNSDRKYVVDCAGDIEVKNRSITSLVNDYFIWGKVTGGFYCSYCKSLTSFKGAPKYVGGDFICQHCISLTSLKGTPKEVGEDFYCSSCSSLKSLKGAPEKVGGDFDCSDCKSLTSLEGTPKEVGGDFDCSRCASLKSYDIDSNIKGEFIK